MLAGALGGTLFGPAPAGAVAREIIELQTGVTQLIQGQQNMQTEITQNAAVQRTLIEQSLDSVNKLNTSMSAVQKTTQDFSAASGARLDTMGTQVQGLSDNVADLQARWANSIRSSRTSRTRCKTWIRNWPRRRLLQDRLLPRR